jgi:hypothetical protein
VKKTLLAATAAACLLTIAPSASEAPPSEPAESAQGTARTRSPINRGEAVGERLGDAKFHFSVSI